MNSIRTKNGKYTSGVCLSYGSTVEKIPQEKFDWAKCGKAVLFWNSSGGSIVVKKKKLGSNISYRKDWSNIVEIGNMIVLLWNLESDQKNCFLIM